MTFRGHGTFRVLGVPVKFTFEVEVVVPAVLDRLEVDPVAVSVGVGETKTVTVKGFDQDNNQIPVTVTGAVANPGSLPVALSFAGDQVSVTGQAGPVGTHSGVVDGDAG